MNKIIKTTVLALGLMSMSVSTSWADKKEDYQKTYNYQRALELVKEKNTDEAVSFLKKEIQDHKDNGYALVWLASLQQNDDKHGEALANVNLAMKYLDKKEDMYAYCFDLRSRIYRSLNEDKRALEDLMACVKLFPKRAASYEKRAEYYLDNRQFELALQDFEMMTKIADSDPRGYAGAGVCLRNLKRYDEAIAKYDYALKLDPKYSKVYAQRGYCYHLMNKQQNAADDLVKSLAIDSDDMAYNLITEVADSAFEVMDFKLKVEQMMQPTEPLWPYYRAHILNHVKRYKEAVDMFEACNRMRFSPVISSRISDCKQSMGDFTGALEAIEEGLRADSTDDSMVYDRAVILNEMGRVQEAIDGFTRVIELDPRWYGGYHKRGWVKDNSGDTDGAIEDYTMSIMVNDSYVYNYLCRGNMYMRKGQLDLAKADFEEVIKRDTIPSKYEAVFYAWLNLGERDKAVAAMDSVLAHDEKGNLYDAACLYSRMNEQEKSLEYLRKALENGFVRFNHIERDDDLDNIRELDVFKLMIEEYKLKAQEKWGVSYTAGYTQSEDDDEYTQVVVEIPFSHDGGVTKVRCKINDLPLHFVFDTGASDVSISTVEATFMLKNGYLSEKDIVGKQMYMTADGNISEGTIINLRKVHFGNLELDNVSASVSKSQKAPLLLGQSVLQRLGKIEIDNVRNILKVTKRVKK